MTAAAAATYDARFSHFIRCGMYEASHEITDKILAELSPYRAINVNRAA
jgi:hypothetical protein